MASEPVEREDAATAAATAALRTMTTTTAAVSERVKRKMYSLVGSYSGMTDKGHSPDLREWFRRGRVVQPRSRNSNCVVAPAPPPPPPPPSGHNSSQRAAASTSSATG